MSRDTASSLDLRPAALPAAALALVIGVAAASVLAAEPARLTNFGLRLLPPGAAHPFGTDALGRDLLARTLAGLGTSLRVGLVAAGLSTALAIVMALASGIGRRADAAVCFLVDAFLGLPHLVLLILVSFALGGGTSAVIVAVAVTHWPRLTRVLRAELLQIREAEFVTLSLGFGRSKGFVLLHHVLPHLVPQALVGFVLLFPHAILHEAGLTFLGFGLEPSRPAIGILLSDAMRTLAAGRWWLAVFPGLALLALVLAFDTLGNGLRRLLDPRGEPA
ncbi:ABC transporter permease [Aureimonas jatrophae]|uniref:Peptide/nickel transport system permease protein n=1 Tax=Aureimonas jatrophae TaxID=1166073 RepID=A0A1H0HBT5_9HYPH|nr:ABC transporter permease [Aureimonas jatrophae]MBB3950508.1 peptide/nickel transport system permease protein [Aureimonas jatrophae]SDO16588.1 peptide/nickel transport system permease protein [Aureimonas jatrophae]